MEAEAMHFLLMDLKTCRMDLQSSFSIRCHAVWLSMGSTCDWSFLSSTRKRSAITSGRSARICPNLTKVGPKSSINTRIRSGVLRYLTSGCRRRCRFPIFVLRYQFLYPCRSRILTIWRNRRVCRKLEYMLRMFMPDVLLMFYGFLLSGRAFGRHLLSD